MEPRPEIVQKIMDAWLEMNPGALERLDHITPEERRRAEEGVGQVYMARQADEARRLEVWEIIATAEPVSKGLDWAGIWAALGDGQRNELVSRYDVLPEQLLPYVDIYREERSS